MNENMNPSFELNEHILELLAGRAAGLLDEPEYQELDTLLAESSDADIIADEAVHMDLTAAAIELAEMNKAETLDPAPLPSALRDRLLLDAGRHFDSGLQPVRDPVLDSSPATSHTPASEPPVTVRREPEPSGFSYREMFAYLAAAVALMLMINGWVPKMNSDPGSNQTTVVTQQMLVTQLDEFKASAPDDLIQLDWSPTQNKNASGEVYWSDELQQGFMVFENMNVNNPEVEQYQLWIFDDPDEEHPADGGVFDIAGTGRTIVPIDAHVPVDSAAMFAVTVERSGGVTVSDRENIPVLAVVAATD